MRPSRSHPLQIYVVRAFWHTAVSFQPMQDLHPEELQVDYPTKESSSSLKFSELPVKHEKMTVRVNKIRLSQL